LGEAKKFTHGFASNLHLVPNCQIWIDLLQTHF
jgi:hypothetical protein